MKKKQKNNIIKTIKSAFTVFSLLILSACYTLKQGFYQIKLLSKKQKLSDVLAHAKESKDRLEKLSWVPPALSFAKNHVGLTVGKSYQSYISLGKNDPVVYLIQAAYKNELKRKTWWFPIVGTQPYLGFFQKKDALKYKEKLEKEGFDTSLGGVQAFSLLGYMPDPIYSSMLDGNSILDLVEVLFHECVHQTLYIPNEYTFNENLADFIAFHATKDFLSLHPELLNVSQDYPQQVEKELLAKMAFQEFLPEAKKMLTDFYEETKKINPSLPEKEFLSKRAEVFQSIYDVYLFRNKDLINGTFYENRFQPMFFNNAVFLGYEIYEAKQKPFEEAYRSHGKGIGQFMSRIKDCYKKNNVDVWNALKECFPN